MKCSEGDCDGNVDKNTTVDVMVGCTLTRPTHPCEKCGRLYWPNGDSVFNRGGQLVFLKGDQMEVKDPPKEREIT